MFSRDSLTPDDSFGVNSHNTSNHSISGPLLSQSYSAPSAALNDINVTPSSSPSCTSMSLLPLIHIDCPDGDISSSQESSFSSFGQDSTSLISSSNAITEALEDLNVANFNFSEDEWPTSLDSFLTSIPTPLPELVINNKNIASINGARDLHNDNILLPTETTTLANQQKILNNQTSLMNISPSNSSIPSPMSSLRSSFNTGRRYKRPHSSSPANNNIYNEQGGPGFDLNSIIRSSPNCLMITPPGSHQQQSSGVSENFTNIKNSSPSMTLSATPGSYGHYLPRSQSNNNNGFGSNMNFASLVSDETEMKIDGYVINPQTANNHRNNTYGSPSHEQMMFKVETADAIISSSTSSYNIVQSTTRTTRVYNNANGFTNRRVNTVVQDNQLNSSSSMINMASSQRQITSNSNSEVSSSYSGGPEYDVPSNEQVNTISNSPSSVSTTNFSYGSNDSRISTTATTRKIFPSPCSSSCQARSRSISVASELSCDTADDGGDDDTDSGNTARVCRWVDCNSVFYDKASLSRHIGKLILIIPPKKKNVKHGINKFHFIR